MKVYTQGSYDIFHAGHVNFLRRCAKFGDVVVGLLSDESFEKYRGYKPINKFEDRRSVLAACEYVRWINETDNTTTEDDLEVLNPDVIAIGTDWAKRDIYKQWGVKPEDIDDRLIYIPYTQEISTTEIKRRVCEANQV